MYGVAGERRLFEYEVPWLPGYEESRPVRVGNAAHSQLQIDVFGEVMDALHHARRGGLAPEAADWDFQRALLEHLEGIWSRPDEGIWEIRSTPRHFTYSKVMAWVAFDRGVLAARSCGLDGPVERWERAKQAIHDEVCARGYDPALGSFVQSYGSKALDASLLLIPSTGFLPPEDPRVRGTVEAVERQLMEDGFVRRYEVGGDDGLPPGEGVFLACSFWLVDAYTLVGRLDDARALFERLLAIRNDVGLLAEEYDTRLGRLVGNFPQAFSHVGLIDSAYNLTQASKPAQQRAARA
jgi:GH15 family glucan-1,4-alpha-glucosidase